jgi:hypothetical protein
MRTGAAALLLLLGCFPPRSSRANDDPPGGRAPHPEPRVIVNVTSVKGPHGRADVERAARLSWGRIVRCYNTIDQNAKGMIGLELVVASSGKVTRATRTDSTLKNGELVACLTDVMKSVAMPKAGGRSTARAEIHVAPGDR